MIVTRVAQLVRVFREPAWCFALVGTVVGVTLCFLVPTLGGIDEPAHLVRSYQVSQGNFVPHKSPEPSFDASGACIPDDFAVRAQAYNFLHYLGNSPAQISASTRARVSPIPRESAVKAIVRKYRSAIEKQLLHCGAPSSGKSFYEFSTFAWYSPIPYLPSAAGVAVGRGLGWGFAGLDRAGRLSQLLVLLVMFFFAIERTPWAKWVFAAVAMLPLTLFLSATVTPDAMTTAAALLVLSSALHMTAVRMSTRAMFVEALAFGLLLGLCKPTYWVVAFAYLLPLFASRRDVPGENPGALRDARWLLLVPIAASLGASELWQNVQRHLFICDVRYFNIRTDPPKQVHKLLTQPWHFLGQVGVMLYHEGPTWLRQLGGIDTSVTGTWPFAVSLLVVAGFLVLAFQRAPQEPAPELPWNRRVLFAALVAAALLLMSAGFAIFCSAPGSFFYLFFGARFVVALVPLFLLALYPPWRWTAWSVRTRIPPALALLPFYAVVLTITAHTVR